jgi:hypothetical protein
MLMIQDARQVRCGRRNVCVGVRRRVIDTTQRCQDSSRPTRGFLEALLIAIIAV